MMTHLWMLYVRARPRWRMLCGAALSMAVLVGCGSFVVRMTAPVELAGSSVRLVAPAAPFTVVVAPESDADPAPVVAALSDAPAGGTAAPPPNDEALMHQRLADELSGTNSCLVVQDGDRTVVSHAPETAFIPASTQKTLVAAAALAALGPDYRFVTRVMAPAPPRDGLVDALWLVGGGDPLLASPEYIGFLRSAFRWRDLPPTPISSLADAVRTAGVTHVAGHIHADDSRHDTIRYATTWRVGALGSIGPMGALTVNGGWGRWTGGKVPVGDPAYHAAGELGRMLVQRGVYVHGGPARTVPAPAAGVVIAEIHSAPLANIVVGMLRSSDNLTAESLTREVGLVRSGQGSTTIGTQSVETELRRLGIKTGALSMDDGSGLSRANHVSCSTLVDVLRLGEDPQLRVLWDGMAVAGSSGTLGGRLVGTPLQGRVYGKTGTLSGVITLSGVLDVGRPVRFAILENDVASPAHARARQDRILTILDQHLRR